MRKILLVLLALLMLPLSAFAAETETEPMAPDQCGPDVFWSYEEGTLTFTGSGPMNDFYESLPWDEYRFDVTEVILEGDITYIGAYAFADFDALTTVDFGDSLKEIGYQAFMFCDGLTSITLPATFKVFYEDSFRSCSNLKEIRCQGGFPSFKLNCLWDTHVDIIFPAERPWSVEYIAQLEEAFHGRVEFLASDGTDPYEPVEETEPVPTEAPTELTEEATEPTEETTEPTEATEEVTEAPREEVTEEVTEAPTEEATESTEPTETTEPETTPSEPEPTEEPEEKPENRTWIGIALAAAVLLLLLLGSLLFGGRKKGKYRR